MGVQDTWSQSRDEIPIEFTAVAIEAADIVFGPQRSYDSDKQSIIFNDHLVPLSNLYRQFRTTEPADRLAEICIWLDDIAVASSLLPAAISGENNPMQALRVCVRHRSELNHIGQRLTDDLSLTLVLETPAFCLRVTAGHLHAWQTNITEAWNAGLANNQTNLEVKHQSVTADEIRFEVFTGGPCTTSIMTDLSSRLPGGTSPSDYLAALPAFETVIFILVDARPDKLALCRSLATIWSTNAVHPLSKQLYKVNANGDLGLPDFQESTL